MSDEQRPTGTFSRLMSSTPAAASEPATKEPTPARQQPTPPTKASKPARTEVRPQDSTTAIAPDSELASMLAPSDIIQAVRRVVRTPGKEVSFVRLTPAEKRQLKDIVYQYGVQGYKTSENEINRIAVNYVLEDHKMNGDNSILARVIAALLA